MPRLRAGYLTDSAAAAEKLARENPQYAFVTPDGTCYQGRMVTGGRADEAGPLGMKRELRALDGEIALLEKRGDEARAALDTLVLDLRATEQALEEVSARKQIADAEHSASIGMSRRSRNWRDWAWN